MVDFRSILENVVGSTLDIWSKVMPMQITKKPMTMVRMVMMDALRPWYRMKDVMRVEEEK